MVVPPSIHTLPIETQTVVLLSDALESKLRQKEQQKSQLVEFFVHLLHTLPIVKIDICAAFQLQMFQSKTKSRGTQKMSSC